MRRSGGDLLNSKEEDSPSAPPRPLRPARFPRVGGPCHLNRNLIGASGFEVERIPQPALVVFDSVQAKLLFESDVFWARASIGEEVLRLWLETYQTSRSFRKRGIVELELP